jgi:hypothetical protein
MFVVLLYNLIPMFITPFLKTFVLQTEHGDLIFGVYFDYEQQYFDTIDSNYLVTVGV